MGVRSLESTDENPPSGLPHSSAPGSSGYREAQAVGVQPMTGRDRSAAPRDADAGERRRKRTSKSTDVENSAQQSHHRSEESGEGGRVLSDVRQRPEVDSKKTSDAAVNRQAGRNQDRVLNGHVDAPVAVAKDATAALPGGPRTSAEDHRKHRADVLPRRTSDRKATAAFPATSDKDSDRPLNGHQEAPVVVAKDATVAVTGGSQPPAESRRKFDADVLPLKTSDHKATTAFAATSDRDSDHAVNSNQKAPVVVAKDAIVEVTDGSQPPTESRRKFDVDVLPLKTPDHKATTAFAATSDRYSDHAVNSNQKAPKAPAVVAKDVTAAATGGFQPPAESHRKFDSDVLPLKTSDHKATTASAATSDRDSDYAVNSKQEAPVVVAKDATVAVTDGSQPPAESRRKPYETGTGAKLKDDRQVSSLLQSVEHQTDIKPVNPDMVIFDVLTRQQATKRHSGSDDDDDTKSPRIKDELNERNDAHDIETPSTVIDVYCNRP